MNSPRCPHCGSDNHLESRFSVLVGPRDLPLSILFTLIVVVAGNALAAGSAMIAIALLVAIAPLFLSFFQKYFCDRCEIEFHSPASATKPSVHPSAD